MTNMSGPPYEWLDRLYTAVGVSTLPRSGLATALNALDEREITVLALRFRERMTLKDAGAVIGYSTERTRQIEGYALRKLRKPSRWVDHEQGGDEYAPIAPNNGILPD